MFDNCCNLLICLVVVIPLLNSCPVYLINDADDGHERETRDITNCGPNDTVPPNRVNTSLQLELVRLQMMEVNISVVIVPLDSVGRLKWVSGFSGSNGHAAITQDQGIFKLQKLLEFLSFKLMPLKKIKNIY